MNHQDPLPEEIAEALFNYDQALARQSRRISLAIEVLEGPNVQTAEAILAAANTLITYGDSVDVQRARMVLHALRRRIEQKPRQVVEPIRLRSIFTLEAFLWAMVIVGGFYIFAGIFAAIVKSHLL